MPVWDINQTHLLVKQAYDLERAHKVRESAFSIRLKQEFVAYHNSELPSSTVNSGFGHFRPQSLFINQSLT
jgi:hypothetical protein